MSALGKSALTEMKAVVDGSKTHGDFVEFFGRVKDTFANLKSSGSIDGEDSRIYKLCQLLAGNKDLVKDRAFTNKL